MIVDEEFDRHQINRLVPSTVSMDFMIAKKFAEVEETVAEFCLKYFNYVHKKRVKGSETKVVVGMLKD